VVGSGKQPTWTTARRVFVVGVFCGLLAGELVRAWRRGLRALAAVPLRNDLRTQLAVIGRGVGRRDRRRSWFDEAIDIVGSGIGECAREG